MRGYPAMDITMSHVLKFLGHEKRFGFYRFTSYYCNKDETSNNLYWMYKDDSETTVSYGSLETVVQFAVDNKLL